MSPSAPTVPPRRLAAVLFCCLFVSQAGILVLAPMLHEVAHDLGVSTATAGQLRAVSGAAGGIAALVIGLVFGRSRLRALLKGGLLLVATGSVLSAVAPNFAALVVAQIAIGAGAAALLSGGIAAAGAWAAPDDRTRVLTWAILGQPAAWVAGLPIAGVIDEVDWRLTWLAVPFAAALLGFVALNLVRSAERESDTGRSRASREALRDRSVMSWATGELFVNSAWAGTLVYCGVVLIDSYDWSPAVVSLVLAGTALTYFPGAFAARRLVELDRRVVLAAMALAMSGSVALFAGVRVSPAFTIVVFVVLVLLNGARSVVTSSFGLDAAPAHRVTVMSLRTATMQFGYLIGAGLGGLAITTGGYEALAIVYAALFAIGALPHLAMLAAEAQGATNWISSLKLARNSA